MINYKLFFIIFTFVCFIAIITSCTSEKTRKTQIGRNVYYEKNKNGILYINIIETFSDGTTCVTDINTEASIYQKYSLFPISENLILLSSSDIGYRIIKKNFSGTWQIFDARRYINGSVTLYSVYVGDIIQTESGTMCNCIDLIYINGLKNVSCSLTGLFPLAQDIIYFLTEKTFIVYGSTSVFELEIADDQIIINKKADSKK